MRRICWFNNGLRSPIRSITIFRSASRRQKPAFWCGRYFEVLKRYAERVIIQEMVWRDS